MGLRAFLDSILGFIGAESLADTEFGGVGDIEAAYDRYTFAALDAVLESRESVTAMRDRLKSYFLAAGVELDDSEPDTAKSNIFIGRGLW